MSRSRAIFIVQLLTMHGERQAMVEAEKIFTTYSQLRFFATNIRVNLLFFNL